MDGESGNLNLTDTLFNDVSLLIQRTRDLQQEKKVMARGEANLFLSLRQIKGNIRSFLEDLDININEDLFPVAESDGIDDLVSTLFIIIRSLQHDRGCRIRDQKRLNRIIEIIQKRARELQRGNQALETRNTELEAQLVVLENKIKKVRKKR